MVSGSAFEGNRCVAVERCGGGLGLSGLGIRFPCVGMRRETLRHHTNTSQAQDCWFLFGFRFSETGSQVAQVGLKFSL